MTTLNDFHMAKKEEGQDRVMAGDSQLDAEQGSRKDRSVLPSAEGTLSFSVVGVGASAGGLEDLQEFFKNTPVDPGWFEFAIYTLEEVKQTQEQENLNHGLS